MHQLTAYAAADPSAILNLLAHHTLLAAALDKKKAASSEHVEAAMQELS